MQSSEGHTPDFAAWEAEIDLTKSVDALAALIVQVRKEYPHFREAAVLIAHVRLRAYLLGADINRDKRFWISVVEAEFIP